MTDGRPLVSVVIPAFNAEATLAATLRSVIAQTYQAIEVVVVDDGSTDSTAATAKRFAAEDARIRVLRQANSGCVAARNAAIACSSGAYIAPIDADDVWHPTKIEKQVEAALAADEAPGFVYCFTRRIDMDDKVTWGTPPLECSGRVFLRHLHKNFVGSGSNAMFLREAVAEVGGYRGLGGSEDFFLQLQLARRRTVAVVPEFLVGYRRTPSSMSSNRRNSYRSWRVLLKTVRREEPDLPRDLLRWIDAWRRFEFGEFLIVQRCYGEGARLLASACLLDPAQLWRMLRFRLLRTVRRRVRPMPLPASPSFWELGTRDGVIEEPYRRGWAWDSVVRLQARRQRDMARRDATRTARLPG